MKTWLVAHRGAPNEARENTLNAFAEAKKYPIGYIEFDVRITKDDAAIIHHDPAIHGLIITEHTYAELLAVDPELAHFEEVISANNGQPLIVELKGPGSANHVTDYLAKHPQSFATSFLSDELIKLAAQGIQTQRMFLAQHKHTRGLIKKTMSHNFGGVTINKWLLTPSFYLRAQKRGLIIFVYTVNSPLWARFIRTIYPKILICTDRPDLLADLS